jgi:hypothetical protein
LLRQGHRSQDSGTRASLAHGIPKRRSTRKSAGGARLDRPVPLQAIPLHQAIS